MGVTTRKLLAKLLAITTDGDLAPLPDYIPPFCTLVVVYKHNQER